MSKVDYTNRIIYVKFDIARETITIDNIHNNFLFMHVDIKKRIYFKVHQS
jgi:hypothetical protein